MAKSDWYTVRGGFNEANEPQYTVLKYNKDGNYVDSYTVNARQTVCNCPARVPYCRHKAIVVAFIEEKRVDTGWIYNHDSEEWHEPAKTDKGLHAESDPPSI
jgi:hypothetical protein